MNHKFILNSQMYDGHHEVHDANIHCDSDTYPASEHQIDLGWYATCSAAMAAARARYPAAVIDGCYYCTNCHTK